MNNNNSRNYFQQQSILYKYVGRVLKFINTQPRQYQHRSMRLSQLDPSCKYKLQTKDFYSKTKITNELLLQKNLQFYFQIENG
ncbi:hypothetical protein pb186bvf_019776 [Paramecium bursaria]